MIQMNKRILAAFCAAVLTLGLLTSAAAVSDVVYFLSLNDTLSTLTADLMPIKANNAVYIPCTVFDQSITGVNLGVFYGQDKSMGTVTLYSKEKTLIFDINAGGAYDYPAGNTYGYRAITRNGYTYLPAYLVCQFFGLEYSSLSTDYGPLIRIKNKESEKKWWLSDAVFISSAASLMSSRLNEYRQSNSGSPSVTSPVTPPPTPPNSTGGDRSNVRVYLAFRIDSGLRLEEILDTLSTQLVPALFFISPSELAGQDDLIRRIVGSGHQLGLLVEGGTVEEMEKQLTQGNLLLEHIVRQRTYTVLVDGTDSQRSELSQRGWLCWLENVDGQPHGRSANKLTSDIMKEVDAKRSFARILISDIGTAPSALPGIIYQLKAEQYDIRLPVETEF